MTPIDGRSSYARLLPKGRKKGGKILINDKMRMACVAISSRNRL